MTSQAGEDEFSGVCPYLGLGDDADSHATYPTDAHRCYRLDNPTRIAPGHQQTYCLESNHVTCPVFRGEGVAAAAPAASAASAGATRGRPTPAAPVETSPSRRPAQKTAGTAAPFSARRATSAGSVGPRPREGGVSMRAATFFLLIAAVAIVGVALLIQQQAGGGDGTDNPVVPQQTNQALGRTASPATGTAGTPGTARPGTPVAGTPGTAVPGASTTPGAGTPGAGGRTYTVKANDNCGTIASANGITLDQLLQANGMTEDACTRLQIGQVLKLP